MRPAEYIKLDIVCSSLGSWTPVINKFFLINVLRFYNCLELILVVAEACNVTKMYRQTNIILAGVRQSKINIYYE